MIINHNMAALNTIRQMSVNENSTQKALAKLSSGLRINSAADDAAGLAISEKMRGQISGLDQASTNAQDGISLVQTAEGALNETTSILQRMRELSVQASNDTSTDSDRQAMQQEVGQLKDEIDRIANTTQFNTKNLLDGSLTGQQTAQGTALDSVVLKTGGSIISGTGATTMMQSLTDANGNSLGLQGGDKITIAGVKNGSALASTTFTVAGMTTTTDNTLNNAGNLAAGDDITAGQSLTFNYKGQSYTASLTADAAATAMTTVATDLAAAMNTAVGGGADITVNFNAGTGKLAFASAAGNDVQITNSSNAALNASAVTNGTVDTATHLSDLLTSIANAAGTGATASISASGNIQINGANGTANALSNFSLSANNRTLFNNQLSAFQETQTAQDSHTNSALTFQIGANQGQTMSVDINNMDTQALALASVNVSTQQGAETATSVIDNAINKVSTERAKLGAYENRLEHTINNLGTSSENITSAESRIRDVDMAKEMTEFQKDNILQQSAQAMLSQANQQPQSVLQLLRS